MSVSVCRTDKDNGQVSACLFTEPKFIVDDTFLLDYSMFFGAALCDYYEASGDKETLKDLSACAYRQMEIAKEQFDEKIGLFVSGDEKQINYASQVWMILAEAVSGEEGAEILQNLHMEAAMSTATATHGAALRLIFSENILTEASKSLAGARISA